MTEPLERRTMMATHTWTGAGASDNWSDAGNWVGGVAPIQGEIDAIVIFNTTDASVQDVPSLALTQLRFDAGSNVALTLAVNTALRTETTADEIVNVSGQNAISGPGTLILVSSLGPADGNTSVNVSGGTLELSVAVMTITIPMLTKTGAGTLSVTTGLSDDNLTVHASQGTLLFNTSQRIKSLEIDDADVTLSATAIAGTRSLLMRAFSFSLQGQLDLTNGGMIFDYPTGGLSGHNPLRSAVQAGRSFGTWKGGGVTSSFAAANPTTTAVGIAEKAAATGNTNIEPFLDQSADGSSILIRFTLLGDANLDGVVGPAGQANQTWVNGDFDYDRTVGAADFNLFAAQFGKTLSTTPLVHNGDGKSATTAVATMAAAPEGRRAVARTTERSSSPTTPPMTVRIKPSIVIAPARRGAVA